MKISPFKKTLLCIEKYPQKSQPRRVEKCRLVINYEKIEENVFFVQMKAFSLKTARRHFIYREISSKISSIERGGIHFVVFCRIIKNDDMSVEIDWRTMKCMQRNC